MADLSMNVTIFTYNRRRELRDLLGDLERERGDRDIAIRLYDDHTAYGLAAGLKAKADFYFRTPQHYGREEHWRLWCLALDHLRASNADLYLFLPDDARLCPDFFAQALVAWDELPEPGPLSLWVQEGREGAQWGSAEPVRIGPRTVESGWMDGCFLCDRVTLERLDFAVDKPTDNWLRQGRSSGVGGFMTRQLRAAGGRMFRVDQSLVTHTGAVSLMNPSAREREPLTSLRTVS